MIGLVILIEKAKGQTFLVWQVVHPHHGSLLANSFLYGPQLLKGRGFPSVRTLPSSKQLIVIEDSFEGQESGVPVDQSLANLDQMINPFEAISYFHVYVSIVPLKDHHCDIASESYLGFM